MLASVALGFIIASVLPSTFGLSITDNECRAFESAVGTKLECTYKYGQYIRRVPEEYTNMIMTIISPSGGASLDMSNNIDDQTRGQGAKVVLKVTDHLPKTGSFRILSLFNGGSASALASGKPRYIRERSAGHGGSCPEDTINRYGGAGGENTKITFYENSTSPRPSSLLHLAGGGGAGGSLNGGFSKGGDAPFFDRSHNLALNFTDEMSKEDMQDVIDTTEWIITGGERGLPSELGGMGGGLCFTNEPITEVPEGGRGYIRASNGSVSAEPEAAGQPAFISKFANGETSFQFLGHGGSLSNSHAAGGGGDGYYMGAGGGAYGVQGATNIPLAAGGGGSGSSTFDDDFKMYEIIHQENVYDPHPRVIFTFDIPAPHMAAAASSKGGEKGKGKRTTTF